MLNFFVLEHMKPMINSVYQTYMYTAGIKWRILTIEVIDDNCLLCIPSPFSLATLI